MVLQEEVGLVIHGVGFLGGVTAPRCLAQCEVGRAEKAPHRVVTKGQAVANLGRGRGRQAGCSAAPRSRFAGVSTHHPPQQRNNAGIEGVLDGDHEHTLGPG